MLPTFNYYPILNAYRDRLVKVKLILKKGELSDAEKLDKIKELLDSKLNMPTELW